MPIFIRFLLGLALLSAIVIPGRTEASCASDIQNGSGTGPSNSNHKRAGARKTAAATKSLRDSPDKDSARFLPDSLSSLYLGMPYEKFMSVKDVSSMAMSYVMGFRFELTETSDSVTPKVTYYFDAEGTRPLYELIIHFNSKQARDTFASSRFGAPNDENGWRIKRKGRFDIRAWELGDEREIVVAAVLPGTEWW